MPILMSKKPLGANILETGECQFHVWAPFIDKIDVHITFPNNLIAPLSRDSKGYHTAVLKNVKPDSRYTFCLNGKFEYPDPASRYQPEGVHGPSRITIQDFQWNDSDWKGLLLKNYIIYELHVGTFTKEGNFKSILPYLDYLLELGVTAIELMPIAQFPGDHNWGYDGVFPFAVQNSYGSPDDLKNLVNTCHKKGLAVILDVVFNHLGPEGNYFSNFAPYFTDFYKTPWGKALNFDGPFSTEVRRFFIENALYWVKYFHIDALRLDAIHAIIDRSPQPFLAELSKIMEDFSQQINRKIYLIGESNANDRRILLPGQINGLGLDAQWNDDFHHSLHTILTGERDGYYKDFGQIDDLKKAISEGFVYSGQYSEFFQTKRGSPSKDISSDKFVVFIQNHDQIGNRGQGERLNQLVTFEKLKLAAAVVLLSPSIPLIFMGEEYCDTAPFTYFIDHSDPELIKAVRQGRMQEFAAFNFSDKIADPQSVKTFWAAKLNHSLKTRKKNRTLLDFYKKLLFFRKNIPALTNLNNYNLEIIGYEISKIIYVHRWYENNHVIIIYNFSNEKSTLRFPIPSGNWLKQIDSTEKKWLDKGTKFSRRLQSKGEVDITLTPNSCVMYSCSFKEI